MSLYLWINILTLVGPFCLSFDKKVQFYKKWKFVFPAIIIIATLFLIWDEVFTKNGIWGFNPDYLTGIFIGKLPLEEILFFFTVPYACLFIFECIKAYFPNKDFNYLGYGFGLLLSISGIVFAFIFKDNYYTFSALFGAAVVNLIFQFGFSYSWYSKFILSFLIAIFPFLIVNGILTGYFTPKPVVWYNESHIMGPRIGTIPVEDLYYNFLMLFPMALIYQRLSSKRK